MASLFLLGPQRPAVNLGQALAALGDEGPVGVISAGWQEGESDLEPLQEIVARPLVDLQLYRQAETMFAEDAWLRQQYRARQEKLIELQRLYRIRLPRYMQAAREILSDAGDPAMLRHEQRQAISQQRALDRHHLRRIAAINADFESQLRDNESSVVRVYREKILENLATCSTVLITGGNVAVLINRLQIFDLGAALEQKNIIAWSAGAMALSDRIVLFHDNTAEGNRDAEVFNQGLGFVGGVVFLPDARHRLRLDDKIGVALLSRRFAPAACVTLDNGSLLKFDGERMLAAEGARRLARGGNLRKVDRL